MTTGEYGGNSLSKAIVSVPSGKLPFDSGTATSDGNPSSGTAVGCTVGSTVGAASAACAAALATNAIVVGTAVGAGWAAGAWVGLAAANVETDGSPAPSLPNRSGTCAMPTSTSPAYTTTSTQTVASETLTQRIRRM